MKSKKFRFFFKVFTVFFFGLGILVPRIYASGLELFSLKDCYEKAFHKSETLSIDEESVLQAQAQYRETLGSAFPQLVFKYSSLWQDQSGLDSSASNGSFTQSPQTEGNFRLKKDLFTGVKEFVALKGGSSFINQKKYEKERARQLLLLDVARAFYAVLQAQANLSSTQVILGLAQDRLVELKEREKVGRTREADVSAMEYQTATLEAQALEAEKIDQMAVEILSFFIGEPVSDSLKDENLNLYDLTPLENYLSRVQNRPDLQAQSEALKVAQSQVRLAKSELFPKVDFSANYYLERSGFRKPIDWDVNVGVDVPLWSWKSVNNSILIAESNLKQKQKEYEAAQRKAQTDIKNAYRNFIFAHKKVDLQKKAFKFAKKEYELQIRDYRFNLVTNVEVLESMNRLYQAELTSNNAGLEARMAEIELKVVCGIEPQEILTP